MTTDRNSFWDSIWPVKAMIVVWIVGFVACAIITAMFNSPNIEADRPNWHTAVVFDLPVNVTREIISSSTTFIYSPRGDERAIFFLYEGAAHLETETKLKVQISADPILKRDPWPAVGLRVIRNNGTIEDYQLPTRGGTVKEVSTSGNATGNSK